MKQKTTTEVRRHCRCDFDGEVDDEISLTALNALKEELAPYDLYVSSEVGNNRSDLLAEGNENDYGCGSGNHC